MKIVSLVENTSIEPYKAVHGLSLYIETEKHKILFDLGPDETIFINAKLKNIDLSLVDIVIISHGHKDHGGALEAFLKQNHHAKIYIQRRAFLEHRNHFREPNGYIGLDKSLIAHPQIVLLDGNYVIDEELELFKATNSSLAYSEANQGLEEESQPDNFSHEHNLVIKEKNHNVLIMGCGHMGILNILRDAPKLKYDLCIGGYHLYNRRLNKTVNNGLLDEIAKGLNQYPNITFYTCHCTGVDAYNYLRKKVSKLNYLACGEEIII